MFTGNYGFFDYKHNIQGYNGQDFGGFAQYLYLAISAVLIVALVIIFRRVPREKVIRFIGYAGIFMTLLYIGKTAWESYYDIRQFGGFNKWLLPFDTCSLIMPAAIITGFGRGKLQKAAESWVAIGGILSGVATMVRLTAFNYYPFLSFGAFYSMLWHFLMVLMGVLVIVTAKENLKFSMAIYGYLFQLVPMLIMIPVNYIFDLDFMFVRKLSAIPFFEGVAPKLTEAGLDFLNPPLMLILYFAAFCLIYLIAAGLKNRRKKDN